VVRLPDNLRVLLVEDSVADAELILRALRGLGVPFEHARVTTEAALRGKLAGYAPHIVLSDFSMPGFSGREALRIVTEVSPDTPFLFVSGTIGEEMAIEALQRGAVDYILKDNLRRLGPAVQRALGNAYERQRRREMERALRDSESRFRSIVESSRDWIWELDAEGRITYSNASVERMLGQAPEALTGRRCREMLHPDDLADGNHPLDEAMARGHSWQGVRLRFLHPDGGIRVLESSGTPVFDDFGLLTGFRGIDRDVTELLQQQQHIRHLARLHAVLGALGNTVLRASDRDRLLDEVCSVAVEHGGFDAAIIALARDADATDDAGTDAPPLRIACRAGDPRILDCLDELADTDDFRRESRALREGARMIVPDVAADTGGRGPTADARAKLEAAGVGALAILPLGEPAWGVIGLYSRTPQAFDADEVALLERLVADIDYAVDFIAKGERLEFLAYHNPVSHLPNRPALHLQAEGLMAKGAVAMAMVDIERFSAINESRGRAFGDALLRAAGERLRALAGAAGQVSHPESDTFAIAYRANGTVEDEMARLEGVLDAFERDPFEIEDESLLVDVRAGLALYPDHAVDAEALERNAMAALAEGSRRGGRIHAFNDELRGRAAWRLQMEQDLRRAIEADEFELHYQPKFEARQHRLVGAEALIRWRHPDRGLVSPAEFIPILENTGLIVPVGRWVMVEALRTVAEWRAAGHDRLRVAINLSARELRHPRFPEQCRELLAPHAADQLIDIEVTESLLMDDIEHSLHLLDGLRDLGCKVSIDDFGTGYSSLNYLARLPVDEIKVDQSFTSVLTQSPETLALVTNIIGLAHSLSLRVVAEGVEDEEQAKLLRLLRCDHLQGYWLGRPVPAAEFRARLLDAPPG
jgi:PAS domain S-box-containing protein